MLIPHCSLLVHPSIVHHPPGEPSDVQFPDEQSALTVHGSPVFAGVVHAARHDEKMHPFGSERIPPRSACDAEERPLRHPSSHDEVVHPVRHVSAALHALSPAHASHEFAQ